MERQSRYRESSSDLNKKLKSFQVVEFLEKRRNKATSIAVVCRKWLYVESSLYFCLWPNGKTQKQVEEMVKSKTSINKEDSKSFPIRILGESKKYETACEQAVLLEEESEVAATDGSASDFPAILEAHSSSSSKRQKKRKRNSDYQYEDNDLTTGSQEPSPRVIRKRSLNSTPRNSKNPTPPIFPRPNSPISDIDLNDSIEADENIATAEASAILNDAAEERRHQSDQVTLNNSSDERFAAMEKRLIVLERKNSLLTDVQNLLSRTDPEVPDGVPMETRGDLCRLNVILKSKTEMATYVGYLHSKAERADNVDKRGQFTRAVLKYFISENLALICNLNGSSKKVIEAGLGKIRLRDFPNIILCIATAVRLKFPNVKQTYITNKISRWLLGVIDHGNGRSSRPDRMKLMKELLISMNRKDGAGPSSSSTT